MRAWARISGPLILAAAVALALALVAVLVRPPAASAATRPDAGLERAYAHNDYLHKRPLYDALNRDFKGVEADVWLVKGKLLVGHDLRSLHRTRTLESLYLGPLRKIVARNGGSVYRGDPDYFTLLIDLKSAAVPTYLELQRELRRYRAAGNHRMFTTFGPHGVRDGAVTAIASGNRPRRLMARQRLRYAAYDGRLTDLGVTTDQNFIPLISDTWLFHFSWDGTGPMPGDQRARLRLIVRKAHAHHQRLRFYLTPENTSSARHAVWTELLGAHIDYINTDHLGDLQTYLVRHDRRPAVPWVSFTRHHA